MQTNEQTADYYARKARELESKAAEFRKNARRSVYNASEWISLARNAETQAKLYRKCAELAWYF